MTVRRRWGIAAALFALLLIVATFPMRLALVLAGADRAGLTAREVVGPVWWGGIGDARLGAFQLGTLDAWLAPGPLFLGRAELAFRRQHSTLGTLSGRLRGGNLRGVSDLTGTTTATVGLGIVPIDTISFEGVEALFDKAGRCQSAQGRLRLSVGASIAGLDLSRGLSGALRCYKGRVQAALSSQSGMERLTVNFAADGAYQARLTISVDRDPSMATALGALGFQPTAGGYMLTSSGRF
jgi:general secretion pathway protein N